MGFLAWLERWFAERIEGGFARLFRSGLHPAAVVEAVAEAAREACRADAAPPNRYTIHLPPDDRAALANQQGEIAAAAVARLEAVMAAQHRLPEGRLRVAFETDDGVNSGELRIVSEVVIGPGPAELVGADGAVALRCEDQPATIGREPDCELVLDSGDVSRHHARLEPVALEWVLVDLQSTNGTTVNGSPVTRLPVRDGDRLGFGPLWFWFREL